MAETECTDGDIHAGLQQMHGGEVSEAVRGDTTLVKSREFTGSRHERPSIVDQDSFRPTALFDDTFDSSAVPFKGGDELQQISGRAIFDFSTFTVRGFFS